MKELRFVTGTGSYWSVFHRSLCMTTDLPIRSTSEKAAPITGMPAVSSGSQLQTELAAPAETVTTSCQSLFFTYQGRLSRKCLQASVRNNHCKFPLNITRIQWNQKSSQKYLLRELLIHTLFQLNPLYMSSITDLISFPTITQDITEAIKMSYKTQYIRNPCKKIYTCIKELNNNVKHHLKLSTIHVTVHSIYYDNLRLK